MNNTTKKVRSVKPLEERPALPQEIKDLNGKSGEKIRQSIKKLTLNLEQDPPNKKTN